MYPLHRPRRLRTTPAMRRLVSETEVRPRQLVLPMFVKEGLAEPAEISSMPGVLQHSRDSLRKAAVEAVQAGVGGIMLFGVPAERDAVGSGGTDPDGILNAALGDLRAELGDSTVLMSDCCLDEFTDHGHCGVLAADGTVDNDATLEVYGEMAVAQARAGAHVVGPSGMMDGQIAFIRNALDQAGLPDTGILAYSAKYASAFYGPFRDAVESQLAGDRKTYQQDPANAREAIREVQLDLAEGADMVMVKPALLYLDVLRSVAEISDVPVAAYQISGEYSMIEAAAQNGWIDRERSILESLTSIRRAGRGHRAHVLGNRSRPMAGPVAPAPVPKLVDVARWLWIASACVGMLRFLAQLFDRETLVAEARRQNPSLGQDQIDAGVNGGVLFGLVIAVAVLVAYTRLANRMARGRNWARIVLTVLGGASVAFGLFRLGAWGSGVAAELGVEMRTVDLAVTLVTTVLDATAIVLMYRVSAHFRKRATVDSAFPRT